MFASYPRIHHLYRDQLVPRPLEPLGPLGELAHAAFVERDLARIFAFRYAAVRELLA